MRELPTTELLGRALNDVEELYAPAVALRGGETPTCWLPGRYASPWSVPAKLLPTASAGPGSCRDCSSMPSWWSSAASPLGIDTAAHQAAIEAGGLNGLRAGNESRSVTTPRRTRRSNRRSRAITCWSPSFRPAPPPRRFTVPTAEPNHGAPLRRHGHRRGRRESGSLHQGWEALRLARPLFLLESLVEQRPRVAGEDARLRSQPPPRRSTTFSMPSHRPDPPQWRSSLDFGSFLAYPPRPTTDGGRRIRNFVLGLKEDRGPLQRTSPAAST